MMLIAFFRSSKIAFKKNVVLKFRDFYNSHKTSSYNIVSLGPSCYPKTILTRWKLKKTKAVGELTLPFDLAWVHEARFITQFIENDFSDFFKDLRYIKEIKSWDNFGMVNFSHETNFGPEDRDLLVEKYSKRINNFKDIISNKKPILFVQFLKNSGVGEDVENLYRVLNNIRGNKPFELLVIDAKNIVNTENKDINILKVQLDEQDPNLYDPAFYRSEEGLAFEKNIIDECKSIIKKKLKCRLTKFL